MRFFLIFLFFPVQLFAQKENTLPENLAGVWAGFLYNDTTQQNTDFELAISQTTRKLSGYTHTIFLIDGRKDIGVKAVKVKVKKGVLYIEDEKLIDNNYGQPPAKGVRTFIELHFSENDSTEILSGLWKTNQTREYNSVTGSIFLKRKKELEQTAIIPKLRQLDLLNTLSFIPGFTTSPKGNIIAKTSSAIKKDETSKKIDEPVLSKAKAGAQISEESDNKAGLEKEELALRRDKVVDKNISPSTTPESIKDFNDKKSRVPETKNNNGQILTKINQAEKETPAREVNIERTSLPEKKDTTPTQISNIDAAKRNSLFKKEDTIKRVITAKKPIEQKEMDHQDIPLEIIPDTTIVNEEITIFMFPKGDDPKKKESAKELEKKDDLNAAKDSIGSSTPARGKSKNEKKEKSGENIPGREIKNKEKVAWSVPDAQEEDLKAVPDKIVKAPEVAHRPVAAEKLSGREIETIRTVEISRDSLVFSLFDNGVIDGDTVSVLLNGKVVMPRVGLLAVATNKTIYLSRDMGDFIKIILYAENLGSIPPNTGLLVIRDEGKDHEIRFSGDLKKNSAIILKRKSKVYEQ